jgi:hypothetical protein
MITRNTQEEINIGMDTGKHLLTMIMKLNAQKEVNSDATY